MFVLNQEEAARVGRVPRILIFLNLSTMLISAPKRFLEPAFGTQQASASDNVNKYSIQCIRPRPLTHLPLEMYPGHREAHGCTFLLFYFHTRVFCIAIDVKMLVRTNGDIRNPS